MRAIDIIEVDNPIYSFDASRDFNYILFVCSDKSISLYDYKDRKVIWKIDTDISNLDSESSTITKFISNDEFSIIEEENINFYKIDSGNVELEATLNPGFDFNRIENTVNNKYSVFFGVFGSCIVDNEKKAIIYTNTETTDIAISNDGRFFSNRLAICSD